MSTTDSPMSGSPSQIAISCASPEKAQPYIEWLQQHSEQPLAIQLLFPDYDTTTAIELLNNCSALLLTGGKDIDPDRYGLAERRPECQLDSERDLLEFALFKAALEAKKPILGICRGCQLINVALGGTLYIDIPTDVDTAIEHRRQNSQDSHHSIGVVGGSLLFKITGEIEGMVNSAHHQAIHRLGRGLTASAYSPDSLIEAIEWESLYGSSFLLGVQWHPERMANDSPLSANLARHFLFEAESYALLFQ